MHQLSASNKRNRSMNSPRNQEKNYYRNLFLDYWSLPPPPLVSSHISLKSCAHYGHLMQTRLLNVEGVLFVSAHFS